VVLKTQKYFLNDQQQKSINQTENGSHNRNSFEEIGNKVILSKKFAWHVCVRVFQKTQNYFFNVQHEN
jgi:hypothetical protein